MSDTSNRKLIAGIVLVLILSTLANFVAGIPFIQSLQLSPLIIGILLGMLLTNTVGFMIPDRCAIGVGFCSKRLLRIGIALFGFRISLQDVMSVGVSALLIDALVVSLTLIFGVIIGRLLRMDSQTALLTSVGSSICGAAAVLGAEPVVKGEPYKTAVAVSTVVLFGTLAMFVYPACYRAGLFDLTAQQLSIYTGATLHEVAHVVGAGDAMNSATVDIQTNAVIVKMIRVIMLAPVLLVLSYILSRKASPSDASATGSRPRVSVPFFAVMFVVVIGFNSLNLLPQTVVGWLNFTSTALLTMAMTALGLNTTIAQMKKAGWKPFLLALILFAWLFFGGYWVVKLMA
ncbi:MAG: YeiH family protein [Akkermansia sp.]